MICDCNCGCEPPPSDWHIAEQPWCACIAIKCPCTTEEERNREYETTIPR